MICWKIRIFAYWTTPGLYEVDCSTLLWFAEKFVSLLIEQHPFFSGSIIRSVVICWKIRIFAYWTTPYHVREVRIYWLWFAEKFVSLLIEQHPARGGSQRPSCCDLLKNSYLCLLNNTTFENIVKTIKVVICWKIRIFAYWTTPVLL